MREFLWRHWPWFMNWYEYYEARVTPSPHVPSPGNYRCFCKKCGDYYKRK